MEGYSLERVPVVPEVEREATVEKSSESFLVKRARRVAMVAGLMAMLAGTGAEAGAAGSPEKEPKPDASVEHAERAAGKSEAAPESKNLLSESGLWAGRIVEKARHESLSPTNAAEGMKFIRDSYSAFMIELQNPTKGAIDPYSRGTWSRIASPDDWKAMSQSCADLAQTFKDAAARFKIHPSAISTELGMLADSQRGFAEKAGLVAADFKKAAEKRMTTPAAPQLKKEGTPARRGDKEYPGEIREGFTREKSLIVHGFVERPDRRRGGIVPDSERVVNGQRLHTEVNRTFGYDTDTQGIDVINVFTCTETGTAINVGLARKGTPEYEKYFPIAQKFAEELDRGIYADFFENDPIGSVLK